MVCSYTDHTLQISNLDVSQIDKKKSLCTVLQSTEI